MADTTWSLGAADTLGTAITVSAGGAITVVDAQLGINALALKTDVGIWFDVDHSATGATPDVWEVYFASVPPPTANNVPGTAINWRFADTFTAEALRFDSQVISVASVFGGFLPHTLSVALSRPTDASTLTSIQTMYMPGYYSTN